MWVLRLGDTSAACFHLCLGARVSMDSCGFQDSGWGGRVAGSVLWLRQDPPRSVTFADGVWRRGWTARQSDRPLGPLTASEARPFLRGVPPSLLFTHSLVRALFSFPDVCCTK